MLQTSATKGFDYATSGEIIDALGTERALSCLFDELKHLIEFEMISALVYRGKTRPILLFDNFQSPAHQAGLRNYVDFSYVLSPCYQACLDGLEPGVYRMCDLVPNDYPLTDSFKSLHAKWSSTEEMGYLTEGWPAQQEEALLIVKLPDGAISEVSLLRRRSQDGFRDEELDSLRRAEPFIAAIIRAHWRVFAERQSLPAENVINMAFDSFGRDLLSARECEVTQLILQGHSSLSISLHLDISLTTVKSHRKNAYSKLNISTQSELLAIFLKSLGGARNRRRGEG
jgi:DNA-binding CsgD family transcriptional regulator